MQPGPLDNLQKRFLRSVAHLVVDVTPPTVADGTSAPFCLSVKIGSCHPPSVWPCSDFRLQSTCFAVVVTMSRVCQAWLICCYS